MCAFNVKWVQPRPQGFSRPIHFLREKPWGRGWSEYFVVHTCTAQNRLKIKWVEFKIFRAILTHPHKKLSWKNNNKQNSLLYLTFQNK